MFKTRAFHKAFSERILSYDCHCDLKPSTNCTDWASHILCEPLNDVIPKLEFVEPRASLGNLSTKMLIFIVTSSLSVRDYYACAFNTIKLSCYNSSVDIVNKHVKFFSLLDHPFDLVGYSLHERILFLVRMNIFLLLFPTKGKVRTSVLTHCMRQEFGSLMHQGSSGLGLQIFNTESLLMSIMNGLSYNKAYKLAKYRDHVQKVRWLFDGVVKKLWHGTLDVDYESDFKLWTTEILRLHQSGVLSEHALRLSKSTKLKFLTVFGYIWRFSSKLNIDSRPLVAFLSTQNIVAQDVSDMVNRGYLPVGLEFNNPHLSQSSLRKLEDKLESRTVKTLLYDKKKSNHVISEFPSGLAVSQGIFSDCQQWVKQKIQGSSQCIREFIDDVINGFFNRFDRTIVTSIGNGANRFKEMVNLVSEYVHSCVDYTIESLSSEYSKVMLKTFVTVILVVVCCSFLHHYIPNFLQFIDHSMAHAVGKIFKATTFKAFFSPVIDLLIPNPPQILRSYFKTFYATLQRSAKAFDTALFFTFCIGLLPGLLVKIYRYMFGNYRDILIAEINAFKLRSSLLGEYQTCGKVSFSPLYREDVNDLLEEGRDLIGKLQSLPAEDRYLGNQVDHLMNYTRSVGKIRNMIAAYDQNNMPRSEPFSLHMYGKQGIGKTQLTDRLLCDISGVHRKDIYSYTYTDKDNFWNGYNQHACVVLDEFLKGSDDDRLEQGRLYLSLISNAKVVLPMASLDNPGVGTKGTTFNSDIVITLNNHHHTKAPGLDDESLLRRRHAVVRMRYTDDKNPCSLKDMSREDMLIMKGFSFDLVDPEDRSSPPRKLAKGLTYLQLKTKLTNMYIEHTDQGEKIRQAFETANDGHIVLDFKKEYAERRNTLLNLQPTDHYLLGVLKNKISEFLSFDMRGFLTRNEIKEIRPQDYDGDLVEFLDNPTYVISDEVRTAAHRSLKPTYEWYHKAAMAVAGVTGLVSLLGVKGTPITGPNSPLSQSITNQKKLAMKRPRLERNFHRGFRQAQSAMINPLELRVRTQHVYVIPVAKQYILCHHHAFHDNEDFFEDGTPISFDYAGKRYEYLLNESDVYCDAESDIMLVDISSSKCPMFPNIVKKFVKESDLMMGEMVQVSLNVPGKNVQTIASLMENMNYSSPVEIDGSHIRMHNVGWKYRAKTNYGDCGCPLIGLEGPLSGKILGFHIAGDIGRYAPSLPNGYGVVVTSESLKQQIEMLEATVPMPNAQGTFAEELSPEDSPNIISLDEVPSDERIHLGRKTKLRHTRLYDALQEYDTRQPAVLSCFDPRGDGTDPVINSIIKLSRFKQPNLDAEIFGQVCSSMTEMVSQLNCVDQGGYRQLSLEEAIMGLPGILSSLNSKTSIGYPLILKEAHTGKHSLFYFDEAGELILGDDTANIVSSFEEDFIFDAFPDEHRFIGYLKDELREPSKVSTNSTRVIYCNDARALISFRMKLGMVICTLNNSFESTGFAIGLNPSSLDMQKIQDYLFEIGTGIIAGDFKSFDQSYVKSVRDACYEMLWPLAKQCGVTRTYFNNFVKHETMAPAQIDGYRFRVVSNNYSGCLLTTIINCLVNNFYVRYCFAKRYPHLSFEEHVRMVCLGDDHLISISGELDWSPFKLSQDLEELNQVYTHFDKVTALPDACWNIYETTFLGNQIRKGVYGTIGAPLVPCLMRSILWTRDGGRTLLNNIYASLQYFSLHSREVFSFYKKLIIQACEREGIDVSTLKRITYLETHKIASLRTAASGADFRRAQGFQFQPKMMNVDRTLKDATKEEQVQSTSGQRGLTDIVTGHVGSTLSTGQRNASGFNDANINERAMNLNFGLQSRVFRQTYTWSKTDTTGTTLIDLTAPYDILQLGSTDNLQNMPFSNFQFSNCDIRLTFQVNAPPTMMGALVIYFIPLLPNPYVNEPDPGFANAFSYNHVIVDASINTTVELHIPFTFWKPYVDNARLSIGGYNNYGRVQARVISPLAGDSEADVNISMFSQFSGEFHVPRIGGSTSFVPTAVAQGIFGDGGLLNFSTTNNTTIAGSANGMSLQNDSSMSANPSMTTGDLSGEVDVAAAGGVQNEIDAELDDLSMDNTMVVGGGIPVQSTFSSMAKSSGAQPTNALQLHPGMLSRYGHRVRDSDETKMSWIMSRRGYIGTFNVNDTSLSGTRVTDYSFDSFFKPTNPNLALLFNEIPPNVAMINLFTYWHADINLHFYAVRNRFMSSRLLASFAYGGNVAEGSENLYYNQVLEFNGENSWASMKIPWNAPTEYLRTMDSAHEGSLPFLRADSFHQLGNLTVTVMNEMRSTSIAATAMDVLMFVTFENVQLHTMRPYPMFYNEGRNDQMVLDPPSAVAQGAFSEGGTGPELSVAEPHLGDQEHMEGVAITETEATPQILKPCKLDIGRKYEFCVSDIHEIQRRYIAIRNSDMIVGNNYPLELNDGTFNNITLVNNRPIGPLQNFFAAWSGHLNYRIFCANLTTEPNDVNVALIPTANYPPNSTLMNNLDALITSVPGKIDLASVQSGVLNTERFTSYPAVEVRYHMSGSENWVNVSVPFFSLLTYSPVANINDDTTRFDGGQNGHLMITNATKLVIYTAAGDDFRFHHWRPYGKFVLGAFINNSNISPQSLASFDAAGSNIEVPRTAADELRQKRNDYIRAYLNKRTAEVTQLTRSAKEVIRKNNESLERKASRGWKN